MSYKQVLSIACKVRKAFEEIEQIEGYDGDNNLGGYCGRASIQLYLACKRVGLKDIKLWDGIGHSFNSYGNKLIDITATQFGKRKKVFTCLFNNRRKFGNEYDLEGRCYYARENWAFDENEVRRDKRIVEKYLK